MKNHQLHLIHYLVLIIILAFNLFMFFNFTGDQTNQFLTAIIFSLIYFLWGIIHHWAEGDLHPKIVVEYLLIALVALFILKGAIYK